MAAPMAWPALILVAAVLGGPAQPGAGYLLVTFNLGPLEADLRARIEREPSHISNRLELARLYDTAGSRGAAEHTLLQALAIERSPRVYRQLIQHYRRFRQHPVAVPIAIEWAEREPSDPEPRVQLSALYLYHPAQTGAERLDLIVRGLAAAEKALALEPGHVPALEMKRQLLALKWIVADWSARPAIAAEQEALAKVFSVAGPVRPPPVHAVRRPIVAPSGAPPLFVGRNDVPEPARVAFVEPRYPAQAIKAGIQGLASFEVLIDEAGKVADAWPVTLQRQTIVPADLQLLEQAALEGIRQWRFAPTLVNGKPVPVVLTVVVRFVLTLSPALATDFHAK
jgi:TonB family protein